MNSIQIKAPAKINLGLNILSKRLDGYHNLSTLFYPLHDLFDTITYTKSDSSNFIFDQSNENLRGNNLILRAKQLLEEFTKSELPLEIRLEKRIPIGAGLGGGSSDAAVTLVSLNELFQLNISKDLMNGFALTLGSDVPFFLEAKPAIGQSRGEVLTKVDFSVNYPIVLINPGIHVSTKDVFSKLKTYSAGKEFKLINPAKFSDIKNFTEYFSNDFEDIVFQDFPEIAEIKKNLIDCGAGFASMTGTGSTVYGIFEDIDKAEIAVNKQPDNYFKFINHP